MSQELKYAFPFQESEMIGSVKHTTVHTGMTLRDYFIAAAMQGMLSNPTLMDGTVRPNDGVVLAQVVADAVAYADWAMKAREA